MGSQNYRKEGCELVSWGVDWGEIKRNDIMLRVASCGLRGLENEEL